MNKQIGLFPSKQYCGMRNNSADNFQTDPVALDPIFPFLKKEWLIIEPACGKGNLVNALQQHGFKVQGFDILNGDDFLERHYEGDCFLTNPPFSIKDEFLERCYELKKPFALLLPLTTFDSKKRRLLFKEHGLEVIFLPKRINFETPNGAGSSSWFCTAWFSWGLNIGRTLTFTD